MTDIKHTQDVASLTGAFWVWQNGKCLNAHGGSSSGGFCMRPSGLVILCFKNVRAENWNLEQIEKDFAVLETRRLMFRQVSATTFLLSSLSNVKNHCIA